MTKEETNRELFLYGRIDKELAETLCTKLNNINQEDRRKKADNRNGKMEEVVIHITSSGGDTSFAAAIIFHMQEMLAPVVTVIEGAACSAAADIAVAGDYRIMNKSAEMMIHGAAISADGYDSLPELAEKMKSVKLSNDMSAELLCGKSDISKEAALAMLEDGEDHFFTAEEALEAGLVDEIAGGPVRIYNRYSGWLTVIQ